MSGSELVNKAMSHVINRNGCCFSITDESYCGSNRGGKSSKCPLMRIRISKIIIQSSQRMKISKFQKTFELFITIKRYIVIYGGRGSGKFELQLSTHQSLEKKCRILCTREIQNSIKDSVWNCYAKRYLCINGTTFSITENAIVCKKTGLNSYSRG